MALPLVISQILAEANRVYFECMKTTDGSDGNSLTWKMTEAYEEFGAKLETIYGELQGAIDNYTSELNGLTDSNFNKTHLHLQAAVPRQSNGAWQVVHPNQTADIATEMYFMDKGRIHCIGLSGSYCHSALSMKVRMYDDDLAPTRDVSLYTFPLTLNGNIPTSHTISSPFWHGYNFFYGILSGPKPASHVVGKFYYFENYGYLDSSKRMQFLVKGDTAGIFYSTAIAWESDTPHHDMSFTEGM